MTMTMIVSLIMIKTDHSETEKFEEVMMVRCSEHLD